MVVFLSALIVSVSAQTAAELENKYGAPKDGVYQVSEDVSLSVKYGEDDKLCLLSIGEKYSYEEARFRFETDKTPVKTITLNSVYNDFLKSFFPESMFGKLIKDNGSEPGSCYFRHSKDYEFVRISGGDSVCGENAPYHYLTIEWKRDQCTKKVESK